jgi:hypothetical protein
LTKYPEITAELIADPNADDCAVYEAANGDEAAQLWLARLFAAKAEAAHSDFKRIQCLMAAVIFSGLSAAQGRVEAVRFYRDCLSRHRATVDYGQPTALEQDERIARLGAAIADKADADRVEVRI